MREEEVRTAAEILDRALRDEIRRIDRKLRDDDLVLNFDPLRKSLARMLSEIDMESPL